MTGVMNGCVRKWMGGDGFLERDQQHCVVTPTITNFLPRASLRANRSHSLHRGPVYIWTLARYIQALLDALRTGSWEDYDQLSLGAAGFGLILMPVVRRLLRSELSTRAQLRARAAIAGEVAHDDRVAPILRPLDSVNEAGQAIPLDGKIRLKLTDQRRLMRWWWPAVYLRSLALVWA